MNNDHNARVESLDEVIAYIQKLKYAIDSGAAIAFVPDRNVYIKIRVDLIGVYGGMNVLVLSFHYAEYPFNEDDYPYRHY